MDFGTFKKYIDYYSYLNPDLTWNGIKSDKGFYDHFIKYGLLENRKYKFSDIFFDFNWLEYKKLNKSLSSFSKEKCEKHYFKIGFCDEVTNKNIKLGCFLLGFGEPYIETKLEVLKKNLDKMKKINEVYNVDLYIFLYTVEKKNILSNINFKNYVSNCTIYVGKGIVGEFIYNYVSKHYEMYDYIILFLDDIEITKDIDVKKIISIYELEKLDILGLPLTLESPVNHEFMKVICGNENYRETNFVELFFYFIKKENVYKYLQFFDKETKWCWGIDLSLYNKGLKLGIYDEYPLIHYFKAKSYSKNLPSSLKELELKKSKYRFIDNKIILKKEIY